MSGLVPLQAALPGMSLEAVELVRQYEERALTQPQIELETHHLLHAGMYARTVTVPAGVLMTGALIEVATTVIVSGQAMVYTGEDEGMLLIGYHVLAGQPHRKQAFLAYEDTHITMLFPTLAKTVEAAEEEFTREAHRLLSRRGAPAHLISGE